MRVSDKTLHEIEAALVEYQQEVQASSMTASTKHTYVLHAENFVRWLRGDFVPGARKQ